MGATNVNEVIGRVVFVDDDVGDKSGPAVNALEQIVAKQRVFWYAPLQAAFEGIDVIDAFANKDTGAKEILIGVGDGQRIEIKPGVAGKDARKERSLCAGRLNLYARLQHGIARADAPICRVETSRIERVGQGADEPGCAVARQYRVCVQGNDVADCGKFGAFPVNAGK